VNLHLAAMGGSQNHGFAMRLPVDPQMVESVTGQILPNSYFSLNPNGTEIGTSMAVIPIFSDGFSLFESAPTGGIINTDPDQPQVSSDSFNIEITFTSPIARELLGSAPYDPFMIKSQDRTLEIHLPGYSPTELADISLFGTGDDRSDVDEELYYVDSRNLPWVLHVPEAFVYPTERAPIINVYNNFAEWATLGGVNNRGWYRNTNGNVNSSSSY